MCCRIAKTVIVRRASLHPHPCNPSLPRHKCRQISPSTVKMPKQKFNNFDICAEVACLRTRIVGTWLTNIYDLAGGALHQPRTFFVAFVGWVSLDGFWAPETRPHFSSPQALFVGGVSMMRRLRHKAAQGELISGGLVGSFHGPAIWTTSARCCSSSAAAGAPPSPGKGRRLTAGREGAYLD